MWREVSKSATHAGFQDFKQALNGVYEDTLASNNGDKLINVVVPSPVAVDDASPIVTSFPIFESLMNGLGADIRRG